MPPASRAITADDVIAGRRIKRLVRAGIYLLLFLFVIWSVQVTVIADTDWERMGSFGAVLDSVRRFIAVDLSLVPQLVKPTIETFMIACMGTLLGVVICIPVAWFGALNITPFKPVTYPLARLMMTVSRSIHEIVWALIFVAAVGLGALAGVLAIAMRSVGFIAKMSAEAIEDFDPRPVEAIQAVGGNPLQVMRYAILPQILPVVLVSRSIHEIVWALIFVAAVGLGALAGVLAIAMRSVGFIAKMSAEAIEDFDPRPVEAIQAVGGNPLQVMRYAILPQILPVVLGVTIFEWEINIRRSAILGLVGSGGLGLVFFRQMNTFNYPGVTTVILAILCLILIGEVFSYYSRKALI